MILLDLLSCHIIYTIYIPYMSIFYNIGRNPNPDYVEIDCEFIVLKNLKAVISQKIGVAENDMRVKHVITNI